MIEPLEIEEHDEEEEHTIHFSRSRVSSIETLEADLMVIPLKNWATLFISCTGALMSSISSTALNVAYPELMKQLDGSLATMLYAKMMLMFMIGCLVGIIGKLGDLFGQTALYKLGLLAFTVGSLFGGFSTKRDHGMYVLIARCITGFGAAFLFTNSAAIVTSAFAPYNRAGFAQGCFQLCAAAGMVLGPVVGGGFGAVDWRWIFLWNVPVGGLCLLLSLWAVQEQRQLHTITWLEFSKTFDFLGAVTYPISLALFFIVMMQFVTPTYPLYETTPLAVILCVASVLGLIFLIDQFLAVDPLFPPHLFRKRVFAATNLAGTCMAYVRNSITNSSIFFFQGPMNMNILQAGIATIPYGAGLMIAGIVSGTLADSYHPTYLAEFGCLLTLIALIVQLSFDQSTPYVKVEGVLALAGLGVGFFQSPNTMALMLSVDKNHRGVAAALNYLTLMVTSMLAVVVTFNLVLTNVSPLAVVELFVLHQPLSDDDMQDFLHALRVNNYITIAVCGLSMVFGAFNNMAHKTNEDVVGSGDDEDNEQHLRGTEFERHGDVIDSEMKEEEFE